MDRLDGGTHSLSERTLGRRHTSPRSTEMTPRSLHRFSLSLSLCVLRSVKGSNEMETRVALRVGSDVGFVRSNERARPSNHDG
jgi:hypothetical protein